MNNISKTIKESDMKAMEELLDEIIVDEENSEHNVSYYKESYLQRIKSHLLQSQIKVIDEFQKELFSNKFVYPRPPEKLSYYRQGHNQALEDQISSLEEVKKELTENL